MTFRLATAADRERITSLLVRAFEPITWMRAADRDFGPFGGHDFRDRFARRVDPFFERPGAIVLVGEEEGEVGVVAVATGSVDTATGIGSIEFLGVDPDAQGDGRGRLMLRAMLRHLRSAGATTATLECLTTNAPALALYRSEGWTEVATQIRFFRRLDGILDE